MEYVQQLDGGSQVGGAAEDEVPAGFKTGLLDSLSGGRICALVGSLKHGSGPPDVVLVGPEPKTQPPRFCDRRGLSHNSSDPWILHIRGLASGVVVAHPPLVPNNRFWWFSCTIQVQHWVTLNRGLVCRQVLVVLCLLRIIYQSRDAEPPRLV